MSSKRSRVWKVGDSMIQGDKVYPWIRREICIPWEHGRRKIMEDNVSFPSLYLVWTGVE